MIGESELHFDRRFRLRRDIKGFPHPIDRSRRCVSFSDGGGACEQRSDLAQLFA
jgi:hypothetical protein